MSEEEVIDDVLNLLFDLGEYEDVEYHCEKVLGYGYDYYRHLAARMVSENLVTMNKSGMLLIDTEGRRIVKTGGYLLHLKKQEEKYAQLEERNKLELDLAKSNLDSNKFNKRWSKVNTGFTLVNLIIILYQIFK